MALVAIIAVASIVTPAEGSIPRRVDDVSLYAALAAAARPVATKNYPSAGYRLLGHPRASTGYGLLPRAHPRATVVIYAETRFKGFNFRRWKQRLANRQLSLDLALGVRDDPMQYADGPSLYQAFGYDSVNNGDPMGLCYFGLTNIPCTDTLKSAAGYGVGLLESGANLALSMPKMIGSNIADGYRGAKRVAGAYREGGLSGAYAESEQLRQEKVEQNKEMLLGMVPGYNTYKEGSKIVQTCEEEGAFACGRQIGKTTFSAGTDAALAYGTAKGVKTATDLGPTMETAVDGAFKGVARESRAGALSSSGSGVAPPVPSVIYREGTPAPSNLTPRSIDQGRLSFRESLSNPYPLSEGQRPVFRPGKNYFGVESGRLPTGSVMADGVPGSATTPAGHVSVTGATVEQLKRAVVTKGKFPKGGG